MTARERIGDLGLALFVPVAAWALGCTGVWQHQPTGAECCALHVKLRSVPWTRRPSPISGLRCQTHDQAANVDPDHAVVQNAGAMEIVGRDDERSHHRVVARCVAEQNPLPRQAARRAILAPTRQSPPAAGAPSPRRHFDQGDVIPTPEVTCIRCAQRLSAPFGPCPDCLARGVSVNGTTVYPTDSTKSAVGPLLPIAVTPTAHTPLESIVRLGADLDIDLWMKDESHGPTYSHKDRLARVAAAHARETGAEVVVVSSSGNHGAAIASACTRLGITSVCLTVPEIAAPLRALIEGVGGQLVALPQPELRWALMRQAVAELGWYPASNFSDPPVGSNPYAVDGYKPIAWEIVEQLGASPDWVVCPTGYGDLVFGVFKGFCEIHATEPHLDCPACSQRAPAALWRTPHERRRINHPPRAIWPRKHFPLESPPAPTRRWPQFAVPVGRPRLSMHTRSSPPASSSPNTPVRSTSCPLPRGLQRSSPLAEPG